MGGHNDREGCKDMSAARDALRRGGVEGFANDKVKGFTDKLQEAAEDFGRMKDSTREERSFATGAAKVLRFSEETQRKLRRPDIYPEARLENRYPDPPRKHVMTQEQYRKKYPGMRG